MKGDFTRDTFQPAKHYQQVLMQQGRAQVDADWNEQTALAARRDETTTADIVGNCGGPADGAAFGVFTDATKLSADEKKHLQDLEINTPLATGDFFLSAGRYYVDGIQCENEFAVPYTVQPDRFGVSVLTKNKSYLLYLDVWQRHITALEDGQIREPALGGPDTGTRVKTVWQARTLELGAVDPNNPCGSGANDFASLFDPGTAMLTADTAKEQAQKDPCVVPPSAGYTGLENQLYRVEIHEPGTAIDAASNVGSTQVTLPGANDPKNQITVAGGTWSSGDAVEIYPSKAGSPEMKGQLAWITAVNNKVLTLNAPVSGFVDDDTPRLRHVEATWKWSRENGSVVTRVEKIDGKKITVSSLGPDKNLGFIKDAWVEILDDALELEGQPGQIAQIDDVDETTRIVTLKSDARKLATNTNGILPERHPKLRRWEGVAAVKFAAKPDDSWLPLENGVEVQFAKDGEYRTGHFWQIPARAATAQSPNGDIEWPVDSNKKRLPLAPRGISHHYCRLGIAFVNSSGAFSLVSDCRCLWGNLASLRMFYVSGDGQEVMPDLTAPNNFYPLPKPLIIGVANLHATSKVRFTITEGDGEIEADGQSATGLNSFIDVTPTADGEARCNFSLKGNSYHQQVTARLLDTDCGGVVLPIIFNANLSTASQVAYDPANCANLADARTVQDAIDILCKLDHGGKCCCVTVGKGGDFESLEEAIKELAKQKVRDICICLLPGDHEAKDISLANDGKGDLHLHIAGCGRGTRLRLKQPAVFDGLTSFTMRELEIFSDAEKLKEDLAAFSFDSCEDVTITACRIAGVPAPGALLAIHDADHVRLADNFLEAATPKSLDTTNEIFQLNNSTLFLATLFSMTKWPEFNPAADDFGAELAKLNTAKRQTMRTDLQKAVNQNQVKLQFGDVFAFSKFMAALADDKTTAATYADLLRDLRSAAIKAHPGVAVVLGDAAASSSEPDPFGMPGLDDDDFFLVESNEISGVVGLMGQPLGGGITSEGLEKLDRLLKGPSPNEKRGPVQIMGLSGTLQLRGNQLTHVLVAQVVIDQLQKVLKDGKGTIAGVFGRCLLTDNVIEYGTMLVGEQLSLMANKFTYREIHVVAMVRPIVTSIADSTVSVGNTLGSPWANASRTSAFEANTVAINP